MQRYRRGALSPLTMFAALCYFGLNFLASGSEIALRIGVLLPSITSKNATLNQPLKAIQLAVEHVNADPSMLPGVSLEIVCNETDGSHWQLVEETFWQVNTAKVVAVIGPSDGAAVRVISPILGQAALPLLTPSAVSFSETTAIELSSAFFRVSPDDTLIGRAVLALASRFSWTRVAIIYVNDDYAIAILRQAALAVHSYQLEIVASVALPEPHNELDVESIRSIRQLKDTGANIFIVAVTGSEIRLVLDVAFEAGILRPGSGWIVARCNYGTDVLDVETMSGVVCIRQSVAKGTETLWNMMNTSSSPNSEIGKSPWTDSVHAYDAVMAIAQALNQSLVNTSVDDVFPQLLTGKDSVQFQPYPSKLAGRFLKELEYSTFRGISGQFSLSDQVQADRYDFLNFIHGDLVPFATWEALRGFEFFSNHEEIRWPGNLVTPPNSPPTGVHVTSVINALVPLSWPFTALIDPETNESCLHWSREDQAKCIFDGVAIRLINKIANSETLKVQLNYTLWTGPWTDLVKTVGQKDSPYDIAVGSITVTSERSAYAVFTKGFYDTGIRILTKRHDGSDRGFFEFFRPFQTLVWVLIALSTVVASFVIMYLDPQGIASETPKVYNELGPWKKFFHLWVDGTYFAFGTFFGAQHQDHVNNIFARIFIVVLCLFVLIIVGAYTANMAAFLTNRQQHDIIDDFKDLIGQRIACRNGTASCSFIQTDLGLHDTITSVLTGDEAVALLEAGSVDAYVSDAPHLMGVAADNCGVNVLVGAQEQEQVYAFPTKEGFPLLHQINTEITKATEDDYVSTQLKGILDSRCPPFSLHEEAQSISIRDVSGLFLLSAAVALFFIFCKIFYHFFVRVRHQAETLTIYYVGDDEKEPRIDAGEYRRRDDMEEESSYL